MNHRPLCLEKVTTYIKKEYLYIGALICFIIIATVISSSFSRDSETYNRMFEMYGVFGWDALFTEMFQRETFFLLVSKVLYQLGLGSAFLFLMYSAISLSVKFYLIDTHSKDKWLSLAFFGSYFFILHDSTQIRFGMSVAFVYLGLYYLAEGKKLLFSAIVILSAVMFHFAGLVFIIMLLFTSKRSLLWLLGMVVVAVLLYPVNLNAVLLDLVGNAISYFDFNGTFLNKFFRYLSKPSSDIYLGMFGLHALLVYFCAIIIYQYRSKFNAYEMLCFNAFLLSIFFYILLKDVVDLQVRFRDMFGFSLVFLVPYIHRWLSEYLGKRNAYIVLLSFFTVYLIKFTLFDKMLVL